LFYVCIASAFIEREMTFRSREKRSFFLSGAVSGPLLEGARLGGGEIEIGNVNANMF
jgi:hypothetical protein